MSTSCTPSSMNFGSRHVTRRRSAARARPLSSCPIAVPGACGSTIVGRSSVPRMHGKTTPSASTTRPVSPRFPFRPIFAIGVRSSATTTTLSGRRREMEMLRSVGIRRRASSRFLSKSMSARLAPTRSPRFSARTSALTILPDVTDTCSAMSVMTHCSRYMSRSLPKPTSAAATRTATSTIAATTSGPRGPRPDSILFAFMSCRLRLT